MMDSTLDTLALLVDSDDFLKANASMFAGPDDTPITKGDYKQMVRIHS